MLAAKALSEGQIMTLYRTLKDSCGVSLTTGCSRLLMFPSTSQDIAFLIRHFFAQKRENMYIYYLRYSFINCSPQKFGE